MLSEAEFYRQQIDRLHARLDAEKVQNSALREAMEARAMEVREWQTLAVELGAYGDVHKNKEAMSLDCKLMISADLLAQAKDRRALIATLLSTKIMRPMLAECEKIFGPSTPNTSTEESK